MALLIFDVRIIIPAMKLNHFKVVDMPTQELINERDLATAAACTLHECFITVAR